MLEDVRCEGLRRRARPANLPHVIVFHFVLKTTVSVAILSELSCLRVADAPVTRALEPIITDTSRFKVGHVGVGAGLALPV